MSADNAIINPRKAACDFEFAASHKFAKAQGDLLAFAKQKPLTALLPAFVVGVIVGKIVFWPREFR